MKQMYVYCIVMASMIVGCDLLRNSESKHCVIQVKVKNLTSAKLYLTDAFDRKLIIDSADYRDGRYLFNIALDNIEPRMVSISHYIDQKEDQLFYENQVKQINKNGHAMYQSAFMLEPSVITINGDYSIKTQPLQIRAGKQTDMMYKIASNDFGYLGDLTGTKREIKISKFREIIKDNRSSYYLAFYLDANKFSYSKDELSSLTSEFELEVQNSKSFEKIRRFLTFNFDKIGLFEIKLPNDAGEVRTIANPRSRFNMLVFWASWCGPCIKEIPQLKELYEYYHNNDLQITSISIDSDKSAWLESLQTYNLPWAQFRTTPEGIDEIKSKFRFSAIPVMIIYDENGIEIKRLNEYKNSNVLVIKQFIAERIRKDPTFF